jgi:hypothetical protein
MVKLEETPFTRSGTGAYYRCFGHEGLEKLLSRAQSLIVKNGYELERMILERLKQIDDLDAFLEIEIMPDGALVAPKKLIKKSKTIQFGGNEPDFMIFKRDKGKQRCYIVELKESANYDAKSAAAEHQSMHQFISRNAQLLPYTVSGHVCVFNAQDRAVIVKGFKNKITSDAALIGKEFCELFGLDYQEIIHTREADRKANLEHFLNELIANEDIAEKLKNKLK